MVNWLEENPVFYNKMNASRDMANKENAWREKAAELRKDVAELKTWYTNPRTRFGCLKKKSGHEDVDMTRDEWVYSHFHFLAPYTSTRLIPRQLYKCE
jgi:Alcohol dehydrogenase transcription factor Myb/SANT-like